MSDEEAATKVLRDLHAQGLSLEECLDRMRDRRLGLIYVMKAMRTVLGISLRECMVIIERRGDYKEF